MDGVVKRKRHDGLFFPAGKGALTQLTQLVTLHVFILRALSNNNS